MNVSVVMAKIAGTLSTANTRSARLITTSARNSGVAAVTSLPVFSCGTLTKKCWSCSSGVTRMCVEIQRTTGFFATSIGLSPAKNILIPVKIRKAAKR